MFSQVLLRFLFAFFLLSVVHNDVLGASMSSVNVAHPSSALTCEPDADHVDNSTNTLSDRETDDRKFKNAGLHFKKLEISVSDDALPANSEIKRQVESKTIPLSSQNTFEYSFLSRLFRATN